MEQYDIEVEHARYVLLKTRVEKSGVGKTYNRCVRLLERIPDDVREHQSTKPEHLPTIIDGKGTVRELRMDELYSTYREHHRLTVFAHKGLKCAWPGCCKEGTMLLLTVGIAGDQHVDVYTKDFELMTVDHIHPKSEGGGEELENKQPMCEKHNFAKGSKPMPIN